MKVIFIISLLLMFQSCEKEIFVIDVELPETAVISSNSRWGVVKYPYVRVRKSPDKDELISSAFRQGDIVKIVTSSEFSEDDETIWFYAVYNDVEGWITGEYISTFDSREQAITASKMFK